MLLEITLTEDDADFGPAGSKIMINDGYVVGVSQFESGSKVLVDASDLAKFKTLYIEENYEQWYILRLNP